MKINKALVGVGTAVVAAAVIICVIVAQNTKQPQKSENSPSPSTAPVVESTQAPQDKNQQDSAQAPQNASKEEEKKEEKVYTPTFMYFVSNADEGFDATMVMIEELKKEYKDRVTFDVRNIDETPEDAEHFPVKDNTPALIMLNTKNDISNILFKVKDKDQLKQAIEAALQQ